jgi:3-hydroxybutyryl-CoA dehydrogenase
MIDDKPIALTEADIGLAIAPGAPVVVVGAGLMGAQIGLEYALAGHPTTLVNRTRESAERAMNRAAEAAELLHAADLISAQDAGNALALLASSSDIEGSTGNAALIVESIAEDFTAKAEVLRKVAAQNAASIIATNTSSIPVTNLGDASGTSRRLVGTHYWNPPTLMPLVELVPGHDTDPTVVSTMRATLEQAGKRPIIAPDIPGFIWNRLQFALLREAVGLVTRYGIAPEAIDKIVRDGLGRRWNAVGPFETMALGGPETFAVVARWLLPHLISDLDPEEFTSGGLREIIGLDDVRKARDRQLADQLRRERREDS